MFLDLSKVTGDTKKGDFSPIPDGFYTVQCSKAVVKDTKSGTGQYISCEFRVVDEGQYYNRVVFMMFNIKNPNAQAVEIGLRQLKDFMTAAGVKNPDKLEAVTDLEGVGCTAKIAIEADATYGDKNVIRYFKPFEAKAAKKAKEPKIGIDTDEALPF